MLFVFNLLTSRGVFHSHNERISYVEYDFENPLTSVVLPVKLEEISGLAYNSTRRNILCHNDEKGVIYELDATSGNILSETKFGGKKDYEGIEMVDEHILYYN